MRKVEVNRQMPCPLVGARVQNHRNVDECPFLRITVIGMSEFTISIALVANSEHNQEPSVKYADGS